MVSLFSVQIRAQTLQTRRARCKVQIKLFLSVFKQELREETNPGQANTRKYDRRSWAPQLFWKSLFLPLEDVIIVRRSRQPLLCKFCMQFRVNSYIHSILRGFKTSRLSCGIVHFIISKSCNCHIIENETLAWMKVVLWMQASLYPIRGQQRPQIPDSLHACK